MDHSDSAVEDFLSGLHEMQQEKGEKLTIQDIKQLIFSLTQNQVGMLADAVRTIAVKMQQFKADLGGTAPDVLTAKIPDASEQLAAVIESTEEAANRIMDAAEVMQNHAMELPEETQGVFLEQITNIFEASNFQDLTGQRLTKVVSTLIEIDQVVSELVEGLQKTLDIELVAGGESESATDEDDDSEAGLLNGPQLAKDAPTQDDIDALFDSF